MNIKERLEHLAMMSAEGRMLGKTTSLCRVTKDLNGIILAATHKQAKELEHKFGVVSRSMETNLNGYTGPFFFDHYALEILLSKAANKIESVENDMKIAIATRDSVIENQAELISSLQGELTETRQKLVDITMDYVTEKHKKILKKLAENGD